MKLISEFNDQDLKVNITEGKNGRKKYNIEEYPHHPGKL